jgi:hypothetical protein
LARLSEAQTRLPQSRVVQTISNKQLIELKGNVHPLARPQFDQGAAEDTQPMSRILLLLQRSPEQEALLRQLLDDQQSKSSPNFHKWLTPDEFGAQFGIAEADLQAVTLWLSSQGFTNINVGPGRSVVEFSGTVAQVRSAFHTDIHRYRIDSQYHFANATNPQLPAALAPIVAGIVSLHNFPRKSYMHKLGAFSRSRLTGKVSPLFTTSFCGSGPCLAVGPADFAVIYNTQPLLSASTAIDGAGQTIAIVGESAINVQDVVAFRNMFGLPANFSSQNIIVNGVAPDVNGSEGESDLDLQWAGAVAPRAKILFVTTAPTETTAGIDLSSLYIVENNLAGIMSVSFGACEQRLGAAENQFYNGLWEQAAAQGITVFASAGDGGSAGCDNFDTQQTATRGLGVSGLASTPFNVAVGGTDFDQDGRTATFWNLTTTPTTPSPVPASALSYIPEVPWNDSCAQFGLSGCANGNNLDIVAGSGGVSTLYSKPLWQMGVSGVPSDSHRDLPDISLFAGNGFHDSFYIMCQSDASPAGTCNLSSLDYSFLGVGGTSVSSPAFAGIMALVDQKMGSRQGNANYTLYALAKKTGASCAANGASLPAPSCIFNDVAKSYNSVPCAGKSTNCSSATTAVGILVNPTGSPAYAATAGYDLATGLGSVNVTNLANNWSAVSTVSTSTTLTVNNGNVSAINHGSSVPVSITVAPSSGTVTPTGDVALIATYSNGNSVGLGDFKLATNGTVTASTTSLTGGSYKISAHYTGDGTFAPSDSTQYDVTVNPESSKVLISIPTFNPQTGAETSNNPSSLVYGSPYIARIDVGNAAATLTFPQSPVCHPPSCPTGTITLTDSLNGASAVPLDAGTFALNSYGFAEDLPIQLPGGAHIITANYNGDSSFSASSSTYQLNVTSAATRIISSNPPMPLSIATPFSVGAIMTMDVFGAMPACNFTFLDGTNILSGTPICAWQANGPFLYVSLPITQSTSGNHVYTVKFGGDTNYAPSTSAPIPTRVYFGTSLTLIADSTSVQFGTSITLTATINSTVSQGPPIGQLVSFSFNNTPLTGNVTYTPFTDPSGNIALRASFTTQPQQSGFFTANFAGDSTYFQSSALINVNVTIPDFSLSGNLSTSAITAGNSANAMITVTPAGNASSPVTLVCPANGGVPPGITCSFSPVTINLSNGNPATSILTISTLAPSSNNTIGSAPLRLPRLFTTPRFLLLQLTMALMLAFLFLSVFLIGPRRRRPLSTAVLACVFSLYSVILGCGGGSSGVEGVGGPVPSSMTLTASSVKVPFGLTGGAVNITANITSSNTPHGTVSFVVDGVSGGYGETLPVVNGAAQLQLTAMSVGIHTISAQYSGDPLTMASQTKGSLNIAVTGQTGVGVWASTGGLSHSIGVNFNLQ